MKQTNKRKNSLSRGFTLTEVMLALFILATSLFTLSELQIKSLLRVWHGREDIDRLYVIKKQLYKVYRKPATIEKKTQKRTLINPDVKTVVGVRDIHKKSSLFSYKDYLQLAVGFGQWSRGVKKRRLPMVLLTYKEPQHDAEQKKGGNA